MRSGRVFWGVLFITIGIVFFVDGLLPAGLDLFGLWKLWPFALILWGLAKIVGNPFGKAILAGLSALLVGVVLQGLVTFAWVGGTDFDETVEVYTEEFTAPYHPEIERASLRMEFGAGVLAVRGQTDALMYASASSNVGRYVLDRSGAENADLRFGMEGRRVNWRFHSIRNRVEMRLHTVPAWDLDIGCGAARVDLDLQAFRVEQLRIEVGASSVRIVLGSIASDAQVWIKGGASSFRLEIPEASGCEIRVDGGLNSKRFSGFERVGDGLYRTRNFDEAQEKIRMKMDMGVSSVRVVRY